MIQWGQLKSYILDGLLQDPEATGFTESQLAAWARWACVRVSAHTAEPASFPFDCDGVKYQFTLPGDIMFPLEKAGLVAHVTDRISYLNSFRRIPSTNWPLLGPNETNESQRGFWEWPQGNLTLSFIPASGSKIVVNYFRAWTPPESDDSQMNFPIWLEQPFAYFFAAYACDPQAFQFAGINEWRRKQDSGNPEHNPMTKQAQFFLKRAQEELDRCPIQDRETFFRLNPRTV